MIEIDKLIFKYKAASEALFEGLSLKFRNDKVNVVLGKNGVGKTTLFDLISGSISRPESIKNVPNQKDIIYQMQGILFPVSLKGKDYARLYLKTDHQNNSRTDLFERLMDNCINIREQEMLEKLWNRRFGDMSIGERRWLSIMCICSLEPKLYIFDEPTSGIDPESRVNILNRIDRLNQDLDKTIILSSHTLHEYQFINCELYLISRGQLLFNGSYNQFLKEANHNNPDKAFEILINKDYKEAEFQQVLPNEPS